MKFYKKYKPLLELNNSKFSVIALTGGRGSMKTGHALRGVLACSTQQKKKTCFFRETKDTINDSLKAELDGIIELEFKDRGFTTTNDKIKHVNGSTMFFKGLKEINLAAIENLKGIATTTDFFVVDEAQAVSKAVWDVLIPTLRKAGCVLIVIYNRIKSRLPVEECLFLDYGKMTAPEGTYFIEVNYPEIQHLGLLSQQFIQRAELLRERNPEKFKRDYLNQADTQTEVNVVQGWSNLNIAPITYQNDLDLHISCDFNRSPNCWILAHRTSYKYFFFDEFCKDMETKDLIKEVLDKYPHPEKIVINGDSSGNTGKKLSGGDILPDYLIIRNELIKRGYQQESNKCRTGKRYHFDLRPGNGSRKARFSAWNAKVVDETGEICIYADPKCKYLDLNCRELKIITGTSDYDNPTKSEIAADPDLRFLGHAFDNASYMVNTYHPIKAFHLPPEKRPLTTIEQWRQQGR